MRMLERWLEEFPSSHRILDLGCGPGSLPAQLAGLRVTGVDVDVSAPPANPGFPRACAESHRLPFAGGSFDLRHLPSHPGTLSQYSRHHPPRKSAAC